jgi:hypothetical protein
MMKELASLLSLLDMTATNVPARSMVSVAARQDEDAGMPLSKPR